MKRQPNNETAAICGLFCGTCPFYPEQCHGCLSDKLTAHCVFCSNGFRDCAKAHKVTRCFECKDFPCSRLSTFKEEHYENGIGHHKTIIEDLEYMKTHTVEDWVENKTKENTCSKCKELIYWMDKKSHTCI